VGKGTATLIAMRQKPHDDWKIEDVRLACAAFNVRLATPKGGSHYKVSHPSQVEILTIPARRPIKPVYIRKLVTYIEAVRRSQER
jgi:hypothetical protein